MPDFDLIVVGDSFAEGRGGAIRADGSFAGFVDQAAHLLGIAGPRRNLGAYGATTQDVIDRQLPVVRADRAPLVGVIVGGNDLVSAYDPDRFQTNLRRIYTELTGPDRLVFTTNWPNIPDRLPGLPESVRAVLRTRFAAANTFLDGLVTEFGLVRLDLAHAPITADAVMWSPDGMHPSPAGHQLIGQAMADLVDEARTLLT